MNVSRRELLSSIGCLGVMGSQAAESESDDAGYGEEYNTGYGGA